MTVLVREELNAADLAWAAADPGVAHVMAQALRARAAIAGEAPVGSRSEAIDALGMAPALAGGTAGRSLR